MLASRSPEEANELRAKVTVPGRRPTGPWQEVARAQGFDPNGSCFAFGLGTAKVMGTGDPIEVNTSEHVMATCKSALRVGLTLPFLSLLSYGCQLFEVFCVVFTPPPGGGVCGFN